MNATPTTASARRGMTLVEILIALAIIAALMAAMATAMKGALHGYGENQKIADLTQAGRSTLNRITGEIRTAQAVSLSGGMLSIVPHETVAASLIRYQDTGDGRLVRHVTTAGNTVSSVMIGGSDGLSLDDMQVLTKTMTDDEGQTVVCAATVRLSLSAAGGQNSTSTATATLRRYFEQ